MSVHCPACDARMLPWRAVPASETSLTEPFPLERCERCGTARTIGDAEAELYSTGSYQAGAPRGRRLVQALLGLFVQDRLRIVQKNAPPPRTLLDVGAGRGRFVTAARQAGYDASGFEPSPERVAESVAHGAPVVQATTETAEVAPGSVDVATVWHVLEHIEDPRAAVMQVRTWLRPGGVVLLAVPNLASLQSRIGGSRWFHLDVPRHRTHFTRRGLHRLLSDLDLELVDERHWLLEHNSLGMWQTWANLMTTRPSYLYNLLKRNAAPTVRDLAPTLLALPLIPVAIAAELAAGALHRAGTVVVVARRPALG